MHSILASPAVSAEISRVTAVVVGNTLRGKELGWKVSVSAASGGEASSGGRGLALIRGSACSGLLLAVTRLTGLMNGISHTSMCVHICAKTPVS